MNVLVVNAGSSTLKYQVIDTKSHKVSAKGSCERVCFTGGTFTHAANGSKKVTENIEFPDHKVAIEVVLKDLEANGGKIDHILTESQTEVLDAQIDRTPIESGRYLSDHFPVTAVLKLWTAKKE